MLQTIKFNDVFVTLTPITSYDEMKLFDTHSSLDDDYFR